MKGGSEKLNGPCILNIEFRHIIGREEQTLSHCMESSRSPFASLWFYFFMLFHYVNHDHVVLSSHLNKSDIRILKEVLQIPDTITCRQRSVSDGQEDLYMLLKRLSYPFRYRDLIQRFSKPVPILSMITIQITDYVHNVHENRELNCNC